MADVNKRKNYGSFEKFMKTMVRKKKIQAKYKKILSDGTECEVVFSILKPETEGRSEEILHLFAELSKSAYIQLGNKMVYGSGNQKEIEKLVANKCNQPAD